MKAKSAPPNPKKTSRQGIVGGTVIEALIEGTKVIDSAGRTIGRSGNSKSGFVSAKKLKKRPKSKSDVLTVSHHGEKIEIYSIRVGQSVAYDARLMYPSSTTSPKGKHIGLSKGYAAESSKSKRAKTVQPAFVSQPEKNDPLPRHAVDMDALFADIDKVNSRKKLKQLAAKTVEQFDKEWGLEPDPKREFVSFGKTK
ncbi:hypothetical protein RFM23_24495 [Mesorhizobium abyssinicae]|uniref:Uncharacterized protein n=1 Tax=Mesorhizobium abyssinicae TaxID=1209958 RepID=A0ABU5ATZ7_9HYPH|nr:hypothetical protein [Mesorhizobium abyssinicae]MDX8540779.1 hypothetical protein [Mesorhizobium abyssinicae]